MVFKSKGLNHSAIKKTFDTCKFRGNKLVFVVSILENDFGMQWARTLIKLSLNSYFEYAQAR